VKRENERVSRELSLDTNRKAIEEEMKLTESLEEPLVLSRRVSVRGGKGSRKGKKDGKVTEGEGEVSSTFLLREVVVKEVRLTGLRRPS